jgi:hypothetical protein
VLSGHPNYPEVSLTPNGCVGAAGDIVRHQYAARHEVHGDDLAHRSAVVGATAAADGAERHLRRRLPDTITEPHDSPPPPLIAGGCMRLSPRAALR